MKILHVTDQNDFRVAVNVERIVQVYEIKNCTGCVIALGGDDYCKTAESFGSILARLELLIKETP